MWPCDDAQAEGARELYQVHVVADIVDFRGVLKSGGVPFAVQVGSGRICAQVAPPCAVRIHVWHLRAHAP